MQETPSSVLDAEAADEPTPAAAAAGSDGPEGPAAPAAEPGELPGEGGGGGEEAAGAGMSGGVHGVSARLLGGGTRAAPEQGALVPLGDLCRGKVALIENVATL